MWRERGGSRVQEGEREDHREEGGMREMEGKGRKKGASTKIIQHFQGGGGRNL